MRLIDIPPCHLARSKNAKNVIVLTGTRHAIHLNSYGDSYNIESFVDDYEDLGRLKTELEEIKTFRVKVSVE